MRFGLTEDQVAFRDAVRDLLAKECPPPVVRAAWESAPGSLDRAPWDALDAMGALGVMAPGSRGGLGLDEVWAVPLCEEAGRAALPHPFVDTVMVAAPFGIDGMVASALGGPLVPCAADADVVLVFDAERAALVRCGAGEVDIEPVTTVDRARRAARIRLRPGGGTVVTDEADAIERALARGALGTAAELIGLGQAMLDLTVAHVTERRQFGVPIGSFQAVKHHLANALKDLAFARPAVLRAAWSLANEAPTTARDVSMAKALASDAAGVAGRAALQCHGAIGYTVEYDLHLFLKRSWALARAYGDAATHRNRIAEQIGMAHA